MRGGYAYNFGYIKCCATAETDHRPADALLIRPDAHIAWAATIDEPTDTAALAQVRQVFDQVRGGTLDRSRLTENANFYFNATTLGDYRTSLAPLGTPRSFAQMGKTRLRGGFVNRVYRVEFPTITLVISTYAEPGENGKIEQFLVAPTQQ